MTLFDASGTAAGTGTLTATSVYRAAGATLLAGAGLLSAQTPIAHVAQAHLVGSGVLAPGAHVAHRASTHIAGAVQGVFRAHGVHNAVAPLGGVGTLLAPATADYAASASFPGGSNFSVDHFIASATIDASSSLLATATGQIEATAALVGQAATVLAPVVHHEASALLSGSSNLSAPITVAAGTAAGVGDVLATTVLRAAVLGDAVGESQVQLGPGQLRHWVQAVLHGQANFSVTQTVQQFIVGGRAAGAGDLTDGFLVLGQGTAAGVGNATVSAFRLVNASGLTSGHSSLLFSEPLPIIGVGNIVAFAEILTYPPPYCGPICGCERCCGRREEHCDRCHEFHERFHHTGQQPAPGGPSDCEHYRHCERPCWWQCRDCWWRHAEHRRFEEEERHRHEHREWSREPNPHGLIGEFRWNQTFGKGDLEICIKDRFGNQRGPVFIGYTMFMVSSTGILHQTGPTDRKPAQADVGKFYVTGTAGENGQPGCWAVRWRYQRTYGEPVYEQLQQFRVVDAVLDHDRPGEHHVRRHCKYGWDL